VAGAAVVLALGVPRPEKVIPVGFEGVLPTKLSEAAQREREVVDQGEYLGMAGVVDVPPGVVRERTGSAVEPAAEVATPVPVPVAVAGNFDERNSGEQKKKKIKEAGAQRREGLRKEMEGVVVEVVEPAERVVAKVEGPFAAPAAGAAAE
jgi:hypothetical protein